MFLLTKIKIQHQGKQNKKTPQKSREELIETNIKYCEKSFLALTEQDKTLPTMWCFSKKTEATSRCKIRSYFKKRQNYVFVWCDFPKFSKQFLTCWKFLERIFFFFTCCKTFWVAENSQLLQKWIKQISRKRFEVFQPPTSPHYIRQFLETS